MWGPRPIPWMWAAAVARRVASIARGMASAGGGGGGGSGPIATLLTSRLTSAFAPAHLELVNESSKHSVPAGSESHFKVFIVADAFAGLPLLARHRAVNAAVAAGGELPVHALSISAKTPSEWAGGAKLQTTPACLGGAAAERAAAAADGGGGSGDVGGR